MGPYMLGLIGACVVALIGLFWAGQVKSNIRQSGVYPPAKIRNMTVIGVATKHSELMARHDITAAVRDLKITRLYPAIVVTTIEMAYDNGSISREQSEEDICVSLTSYLDASDIDYRTLRAIDWWLANLDRCDVNVVAAGEDTERRKLLRGSPALTEELIDDIFRNVIGG